MINAQNHQIAPAPAMGHNAENPLPAGQVPTDWIAAHGSPYLLSLASAGGLKPETVEFIEWLSLHIQKCQGPDELIRLGCLIVEIGREMQQLLEAALIERMEGRVLSEYLQKTGAPYLFVYRELCLSRDKACQEAVGWLSVHTGKVSSTEALESLTGVMGVIGRITRGLGVTLRRLADISPRS